MVYKRQHAVITVKLMENQRAAVAVWAVQMLTYLVIQYSVSESRLTDDSFLGQKEQILVFNENT